LASNLPQYLRPMIIDPLLIDQRTAISLDSCKSMVAVKWCAVFSNELINTGIVQVQQPDLFGAVVSTDRSIKTLQS
jgi:hypothetical protein